MPALRKRAPSAPAFRTGSERKLALSDDVVDQILGRLRKVEGQVRAVQRMIEQRRDCHAIAQQMSAAKSALERATVQLMASSMAECLRPNGNVDEQELANLTNSFIKLLS